jgi:hypothetical protein
MLERDGKLNDYLRRVQQELDGTPWSEVRNSRWSQTLLPAASQRSFYPKLFPKPADFENISLHVNKVETTRTTEMVDLIRRKSGKKNIVFIIDEVGPYVSAKPSLILNFDRLAKISSNRRGQIRIFRNGSADADRRQSICNPEHTGAD